MEKIITFQNTQEAQTLFGRHDQNLDIIEKQFQVKFISRGQDLKIRGKDKQVEKAYRFVNELLDNIRCGKYISKQELSCMVKSFDTQPIEDFHEVQNQKIELSSKEKRVGPRTKGQNEYVEAIRKYDITFSLGPAGTGKTYLAMAMAVEALKKGEVRRIILTRPAIEAGESLGFLPGDMYEKISPYLRPLYDALYDMMEAERIEKYLETGIIEVAPLAYMRGRTLNDAFIILDEAQNATREQMKMFLTRLGFDSKAVITGDVTQSDLPDGKPIGLLQAEDILKSIEGINFIYLTGKDVVRHELVQRIIEAYEKTTHK